MQIESKQYDTASRNNTGLRSREAAVCGKCEPHVYLYLAQYAPTSQLALYRSNREQSRVHWLPPFPDLSPLMYEDGFGFERLV